MIKLLRYFRQIIRDWRLNSIRNWQCNIPAIIAMTATFSIFLAIGQFRGFSLSSSLNSIIIWSLTLQLARRPKFASSSGSDDIWWRNAPGVQHSHPGYRHLQDGHAEAAVTARRSPSLSWICSHHSLHCLLTCKDVKWRYVFGGTESDDIFRNLITWTS